MIPATLESPDALLELDDYRFQEAWAGMTVAERGLIPDAIAGKCRSRFAALTRYRLESPAARQSAPRERVEVTPIPGYLAAAIWEGHEPSPYVVKHLLEPGALTVLYGASSTFKSVAAVDLALCVGTGSAYHGHNVRRGGVLYVAGEGHRGLRKRIRAWLIAHGMDATSDPPAVYVTERGANLMQRPDELRATVEAAAAAMGMPVVLIVVDTLAANFGPGDENAAADMALALGTAASACPEAAVLVLHHIGHGQGNRERGSYVLIGAADFRLLSEYDPVQKVVSLSWQKAKDYQPPRPLTFTWRAVPLDWLDADGEEETSVVLDALEGAGLAPSSGAGAGPRLGGLGANQEKALRYLRTLYAKCRRNVAESGRDASEARVLIDGWRRDLEGRGIPRNRFSEVLKGLQDRRLVRVEEPFVWPVENVQ